MKMFIGCFEFVYIFLKAMESKLLIGGKSIVDKTTEQERALEERRKQIAEQKVCLCVYVIKISRIFPQVVRFDEIPLY